VQAIPTTTVSTEGLQWAQRLVRMDTRSACSNLALIECIADHLRSLQVPVRLTYDEGRRKANLFASLGEGKPAGIILSGHTDTVPWEGQAWTRNPLSGEVHEGRLYARGSADMKGFIGLCVAQAQVLLEADAPHAIHFAFSFDEEVGCFGVKHLIADLKDAGIAPRLCIVGEPTGMRPAVAHKGVYRWKCCVKGKAAHSSQTPLAVNAIEAAGRLIGHIAGMADGLREQGPYHPGFDVPFSTGSVGQVHGGIADNVVPEDCHFHYEWRNLPGVDALALHAQVQAKAAALLPAMRAVTADSGIRFEEICAVPDFLAPAGDAAVALAQRLSGHKETGLVAFGTEAGLFQRAGIASVVCGPGFIDQAHQADEFVALDQLSECERFLRALGEIHET
jgi:acetylornithine deacetylase